MKYKPRHTLQQRTELYKMIKDFAIKNDYKISIIKNNQKMEKQQTNKKGFLFKNDNKKNENHPDYNGKIHINGKDYYLSSWINTAKSGSKYMSVTIGNEVVEKVEEKPQTAKKSDIDDLPF